MGTISKVKNVQGNGVYENANGVKLNNGKVGFYSHDYEFEDGQTLKANHTTIIPFPIGSEIEYEIKGTNTYGSWGKVSKPKEAGTNQSNAPKSPEEKSAIQKAIIYQSAFKEAVGYLNIKGFSKTDTLQELCDTADYIAKYVIQKSGI